MNLVEEATNGVVQVQGAFIMLLVRNIDQLLESEQFMDRVAHGKVENVAVTNTNGILKAPNGQYS